MSNFAEMVKQFYSQGYSDVYDEGQSVNIDELRPSQGWSFHVHGLELEAAAELDEEEFDSADDYDIWVRHVRFSFYLEGINVWLPDMQKFDRMPACLFSDQEDDPDATVNQVPESVWESYNFYYQNVQKADWGGVWALRVTIEQQDTFAIRVTTDGSDGWLEVFDTLGNNLASARIRGGRSIAWRSSELIRQQVNSKPRFPPELN
jgi:hypothetical protein